MRKLLAILSLVAVLGAAGPVRADFWEDMRNAGPGELGLNKTTGGALIGAIGGGLLGSQFGKGDGKAAATAIGVVAGALAGGYIGRDLDEADRAAMERSSRRALTAPIGRSVAWRNPDTGNSGKVTPVRTYRGPDGEPCRDLERTVVIDGRTERATATACRGPDGNWEVRS